MNCRAKVVFPVPKEPMTATAWDLGRPPSSISSSPSIPVLTLGTSMSSPDTFGVHHYEPVPRRHDGGEPGDPLLVQVGEQGDELLHVHVALPLGRVLVPAPLEHQGTVHRVQDHPLLAL